MNVSSTMTPEEIARWEAVVTNQTLWRDAAHYDYVRDRHIANLKARFYRRPRRKGTA